MSNEDHLQESATSLPSRRTFLGCGRCVRAIVVAFVLLFVIAWLLPPISADREAARRAVCCNNLKQIGVAIRSYIENYGCYPPAYSVDRQGRPMHSWRVLLLEFLDPQLHARYNFSQPWDSQQNMTVAGMRGYASYYCPSDFDRGPNDTSYMMLVGPSAISDGPTARKRNEITDDPANTIIVVEMSRTGICWTEPRDLEVSAMYAKKDEARSGMRSCHKPPGVVNVLFADGHIAAIFPDKLPPGVLKALTTINGGEDMSKFRPE